MDRLDVLNTKLIDLINRPVKYRDSHTKRRRTARIDKVDENGAIVINRFSVVKWVAWEDLEWDG